MTSIGSSNSFWAQDQKFWSDAKANSAQVDATNSLISTMANIQANLSTGLSSIANQKAINRVNSQISSIVQQVLKNAQGGSSTSSSSSSSSSASSSSAATSSTSAAATTATVVKAPATLTGKAILTSNTSLSSLGIYQGGTITVSASTRGTTYTSTGTDTVGDLINAINVDLPTNAQVTAALNSSGRLVITSRNNKDSIAVVGSGTDAAAIGFAAKNNSAQPTAPSSTTSGTSTGSSTSSSSSGTSTASSSANLSTEFSKSLAQQRTTSAQGILTASGVKGTYLNLLT
jgi:hypothetical protein